MVGLPYVPFEESSDLSDQLIPRLMSERVVHLLELVDVDEEQ